MSNKDKKQQQKLEYQKEFKCGNKTRKEKRLKNPGRKTK